MGEGGYPTADAGRPRRRRRWLGIALLVLLGTPVVLWAFRDPIFRWVVGRETPGSLVGEPIPVEAREIVARALVGLEGATLIDVHAHVAGRESRNGNWVNPRLESVWHPIDVARGTAFRYAGLGDPEAADVVWVERLQGFAEQMPIPSRHHLLAFDRRYDVGGAVNLDRTEFHVPNTWTIAGAAGRSRLVPAGSVHPLRPDAAEEVARCAAAGIRLVKWLPSAQGINPSHPDCAPFYEAMVEHDLTLLVHAGDEGAVGGHDEVDLNNPLHLRHPLRAGVRVVVAHCACDGEGIDLDDPGRGRVPNTELFLRLMDEPAWEGQLFGEISAVTLANRFHQALGTLLTRPDLHPRLVHGSDWPLPAVRVLFRLDPLVDGGYLDAADVEPLRALYAHNPLLFDFVLKRVVRHPETGQRFEDVIFRVRPEIPF